MDWASDLQEGDTVTVWGIPCIGEDGSTHTVKKAHDELYIVCKDGMHFLDGQLDGTKYIGIVKV